MATSLIGIQIVGNSFLILQELLLPAYDLNLLISQGISLICLFFILLYPMLLVNTEPLHVLKCTSVIYKRRKYSTAKLWFLFSYQYLEPVLLSVIILITQNGIYQSGIISFVCFVKLIVFKSHMKNIEFIKQSLILLLFLLINSTFYIPVQCMASIKMAILVTLLAVLGC